MSGSSFGTINTKRCPRGHCIYCFDENHTRRTGFYFEPRQHMIGPVCKHRLLPVPWKRHSIPAKLNRIQEELRRMENERLERGEVTERQHYWYMRATQPDYVGEPGELTPAFKPQEWQKP